MWRPIAELPEGKSAILWQPDNEEFFRREGMVIGRLKRKGWEKHNPPFWVVPDNISGHDMECEITHPTLWMELPAPPEV